MIYLETNYVGEEYDLNHPRLLWNSISRRGTVAVSTEAAGYAGVNAASAITTTRWKPTAIPANWTLTFDTTEIISAVAIDTHTLGSNNCKVAVQEWTGAAWSEVVSASPTNDEPIAFLFEARELDRIRVNVTLGTIPSIAVIHCSEALELPQKVYMGAATPIDMALVTEFDTNVTTKGQYAGRSVLYSKNDNSFQVSHLRESWVRDNLMPFIKDAREYPYFLLERPYSHPTALSYRWREGDITPSRMGITNHMQVDL